MPEFDCFARPPRQFQPRRYQPQRRSPANKWNITTLNIDVANNLVSAVNEIARERGVSLYGQIRDFIEEGVRNYQSARASSDPAASNMTREAN